MTKIYLSTPFRMTLISVSGSISTAPRTLRSRELQRSPCPWTLHSFSAETHQLIINHRSITYSVSCTSAPKQSLQEVPLW